MSVPQVIVIAGTHGNEINAPWLLEQWIKDPELINTHGFRTSKVIGNPEALKVCKRYLHSDLNRSFRLKYLDDIYIQDYEVIRARELLAIYGPNGSNSCQLAIDIHSTTSAMGTSLVVYGRRPSDLAIASLLQSKLGLPIYLHEGDETQQGFLVESWPCGIVIEIGPVPQGLLHANIINQTRLTLEICFEELAKVSSGSAQFPKTTVIHRHIRSIDFPRSKDGKIEALIHPHRQGKDWIPINNGEPLFLSLDGSVVTFDEDKSLVPVFINEAAYSEKKIAMSLTQREVLYFSDSWKESLKNLFI